MPCSPDHSKQTAEGPFIRRSILCLLMTFELLTLSSRPAQGQARASSERQGVVAIGPLVDELLTRNPELQALRKRYEAALTRPNQDSALPDPRITAGWISNGNPLPGFGLGAEPTSNVGF